MPDQSTDMERAPDINRTEVEAIGEVLASLEVGDGDNVSGTNDMSIHFRTLAKNTPANAATGATPSPPAHTVPITAATTAPIPGHNEANSSSNPSIPDVDQQDWVTGNSDGMFDMSNGLCPPNMPAGSSTGEPLGWPSNNHLAQSLIDFAREEAFYDTERAWLIFDRARRQLFLSRLNAIEQQERERPNTEDPYGKDAHGLTEMGRLQLDHVDYIRLYGDPLPLNTDVGEKCLTAEAAAEDVQAWFGKVKRWKVPAVDSEIFRYF